MADMPRVLLGPPPWQLPPDTGRCPERSRAGRTTPARPPSPGPGRVRGASRQVRTCLRSSVSWSSEGCGERRADGWIRRTTIGCVALLALIAGTVSYLHMHMHMHMLVALHEQPGRGDSALTPLSVDGMIVAASATLLADSRSGRQGGVLPWALLVAGSVASLAANMAVAEPSLIGRVIAAWPSFALTASFELLTRQVRRCAAGQLAHHDRRQPPPARPAPAERGPTPGLRVVGLSQAGRGHQRAGDELRRQAWQWALAHRGGDGMLPSGEAIARAHGRKSGGVGLSRAPAGPVHSAPSTHHYRDSPLTRGERVLHADEGPERRPQESAPPARSMQHYAVVCGQAGRRAHQRVILRAPRRPGC